MSWGGDGIVGSDDMKRGCEMGWDGNKGDIGYNGDVIRLYRMG
jgi:hypothetical protein